MATLFERIDALACEDQKAVLHDILDGVPVRDALLARGLRPSLLYIWIDANHDFAYLHAEVARISAQVVGDRLTSCQPLHENPRHAAIIARNRQWDLERRHRDVFGSRTTIEHTGSKAAVSKARDRLLLRNRSADAPSAGPTLEGRALPSVSRRDDGE